MDKDTDTDKDKDTGKDMDKDTDTDKDKDTGMNTDLELELELEYLCKKYIQRYSFYSAIWITSNTSWCKKLVAPLSDMN